ncbi:MAG TPA: PEP-CTERM sorting domain-containing protein [Phycisphaerae bacterium]|nr:PEP-CTERM sorting domain-containing protein [Phycisphaerae bacterium]
MMNVFCAVRRVVPRLAVLALLCGTAMGDLIYQATFSGAAGSSNGDAIYGVTGGTATIRDNGTGTAEVVAAPGPVAGGYLRTFYPNGAAAPYGARITPASPANSLAALFSTDPTSGQRQLEGGLDFFFQNDTDLDRGEELRFIDNDNRGSGGLRLVVQGGSTSGDLYVEVIGNTGAFGDGTTNKVTKATSAFQILANRLYHLGVTFSTDDATGQTTVRLFGLEGNRALDTSAATLAEGFLGSLSFNLDESVVTNGFISGAYDIGSLRNSGADKVQYFDHYRLYDAVPSAFLEVPEPCTLILTSTGLLGVFTSLRRRRRAA